MWRRHGSAGCGTHLPGTGRKRRFDSGHSLQDITLQGVQVRNLQVLVWLQGKTCPPGLSLPAVIRSIGVSGNTPAFCPKGTSFGRKQVSPVRIRYAPPGRKAEPICSPSYKKGESAMIEAPAVEIKNPYYVEPHHASDFLCSRLDRIPWYTSGFQ